MSCNVDRMPLTHEIESEIARWIQSRVGSDIDCLIRCLAQQVWLDPRCICPQLRYVLRPEIRDKIRSRAPVIIKRDFAGRYTENQLAYCSDGRRLWTELA